MLCVLDFECPSPVFASSLNIFLALNMHLCCVDNSSVTESWVADHADAALLTWLLKSQKSFTYTLADWLLIRSPDSCMTTGTGAWCYPRFSWPCTQFMEPQEEVIQDVLVYKNILCWCSTFWFQVLYWLVVAFLQYI